MRNGPYDHLNDDFRDKLRWLFDSSHTLWAARKNRPQASVRCKLPMDRWPRDG
jgi:hypothetical protein